MTDDATLERLGRAIERAFPDAGPARPLRALNEGFYSLAVETPGGIVFLVGRNAAAVAGHRTARALLPALRGRVPVAVPEPRWHAPPCDDFPHGILGYRKLAGTSLHPDLLTDGNVGGIARDVAAFLLALHRFRVDEARALGVTAVPPFEARFTRLRDESLPPLRDLLAADEYATVARWWDAFLADKQMRAHPTALLHRDLWYEHLLLDEDRARVTGVIDFADASLGDPAEDFATQVYLGGAFLERVLAEYRALGGVVDADLRHRIARYFEVREFGAVPFSIHHDPAEMPDTLRKIRQGAVLDPAAFRWLSGDR